MGPMDTTQRVLSLLGLLEARTSWQAEELADRLGVTTRTIRRDVVRLRDLGYPIDGERGLDGGYRLGAGKRLPPLILDDEEAVALVACLRMAALGGADSVGEAGLRALAKVDQVMPPTLRAVAEALDDATEALPQSRPDVDPRLLLGLAAARRDRKLVRFDYTKPGGEPAEREVEPVRLATQGRLWYLQAFDRGRDDWRVFRLDRMTDLHVLSWGFTPREAPSLAFDRDIADRLPCTVTVAFTADSESVAARIPTSNRGEIRPTPNGCRVRVGAMAWRDAAWYLIWTAHDLEAELVLLDDDPGTPHLRRELTALARSAQEAVG